MPSIYWNVWFCRRISNLKLWRARYAIACTPNGGIQMDGILMRLGEDHFWYVQANGEIESWLVAILRRSRR